MDTLAHDLRLAFRSLVRRPGFTLIAVLTLALGVGASTSMFSMLHGVVLKPLPYPDPERVVRLFPTIRENRRAPWTGADFVDFGEQATSYRALAGFQYVDYSMPQDSAPRRVVGASVTRGFFAVFGVSPLRGRLISPDADALDGARVAVLSEALWRSRFAADEGLVGDSIELNGDSFTVAGVAPSRFDYPQGAQLWVASRFRAPESADRPTDPAGDRGDKYFHVVARLRDGVTATQAREEGQAILGRLARAFPETNREQGFDLTTLHEVMVASIRPMLVALFGSAALVLLVACANVANILLARAAGRTHEMAVRASLGAGRWHVARQLLSESALLGLLGGGAGIAVAFAGRSGLMALIARDLPRSSEVSLSLPVLTFALAASLLSGLFFGLAPLLWLRGSDPAAALREGASRSVAGTARTRSRSALVAAEMAISLSLLVGVNLLGRTLAMLSSVDPGFSELEALTAQVWLPGSAAPSDDELCSVHDALLRRVRALPGVVSAGAVLGLPVEQAISARTGYSIEGRVGERGEEAAAGLQVASPDYFESIGIPVLRGRSFRDSDGRDGLPVVVISQTFAEQFFPGEDPLGRRIGTGHPEDDDFEWSTIVGVVGSTRHAGLGGEPRAEAYRPLAQQPMPWISLVLKTSVPPASLVEPLRRAIGELNPSQPVERVVTMAEILHESLARQRVHALLLGLFAGVSLTLAAIGLYGVMAFSVTSRAREIGIRIAVGADSRKIVALVLAQGGRLLAAGLVAGLVGGLVVGRLLRAFLYEVPPADPPSFLAAALSLTLASLIALLLPTWRALRTDPIASLRSE